MKLSKKAKYTLNAAVATLCMFLYGPAFGATAISTSSIYSCGILTTDYKGQSLIVNGGLDYRAKVFSSWLSYSNGQWNVNDTDSDGWSTNAVVPFISVGGSVNRRLTSNHFYQECAGVAWHPWKEESTDQIGCGTNP